MERESIQTTITEVIERKLEDLKICQKPFLTVNELADYIGCKKSYIYKLTHNREIPHYKPSGKLIYFNREEIDEWVQSERIATKDEIRCEGRRRIKALL